MIILSKFTAQKWKCLFVIFIFIILKYFSRKKSRNEKSKMFEKSHLQDSSWTYPFLSVVSTLSRVFLQDLIKKIYSASAGV